MFNDIIIKMHLVKTCLFIITVTFMYKCNLIVNIKISVRALLVPIVSDYSVLPIY